MTTLAPPPLIDEPEEPVHSGTFFQRARQRTMQILSVGALGAVLVTGGLTAVTAADVATAPPAEAVTVGAGKWPPQLFLYFDKSETRWISGKSATGVGGFVAAYCAEIPGGRKLIPIKYACGAMMVLAYKRLDPIFDSAARQGKCVRVSYPPLHPSPNPAPYSRVVNC